MKKRRIILGLAAFVLAVAGTGIVPASAAEMAAQQPVSQARPAAPNPAYVPGQLIVRLAPNAPSINLINLIYGTKILGTLLGHSDTFLLKVPSLLNLNVLLNLLSLDPRIALVELNSIVLSPYDGSTDRVYGWSTDPAPLGTQDASVLMHLDEVHALGQGAGALVAVLDTGVQLNHPGLAGALAGNGFDFVSLDANPAEQADGLDQDHDGNVDEAYGHGTHVAGIVHLVAPQAQILPVRVLNSDGRGNVFAAANAILYAALNGADVINLSLGSAQPSLLLRTTVAEANALGTVVVAAAGNLNSSAAQYPAAENCAIAVTAVDAETHKAAFASYGAWVEASAPGVAIYSTVPGSGYAWWNGTSMSTPFVAGQAALLRGENPGLSTDDLARYLGGTTTSIDALNPGYIGQLGEGLIDPLASLQAEAAGNLPSAQHNLLAAC